MGSLYEAIALVVLVSLIGFWEWRSALLMALSIPITLAMTFGMMALLGIDLQQVSIASLIIALGLLVDDPVVAGDAIKRELAAGHPPVVAAWLGPTKLATAILFATITNIVAYLPFLLLSGDTGKFLYSLPVVDRLLAGGVAHRVDDLHPAARLLPAAAEGRAVASRSADSAGFAALYYRVGRRGHRAPLGVPRRLAHGHPRPAGSSASQLKTQFFPKDLQYLSYVDVWLPEDAPLSATQARHHRGGAHRPAKSPPRTSARRRTEDEAPRPMLKSLTTFVGGGGPRFWFSVAPEQPQPNYAQVLIEVDDKHDTDALRRAAAARARRADRRRAGRRAAARDRRRRRHPGRDPALGRGHPDAARAWRTQVGGHLREHCRRRRGCATTGAPRASPCGWTPIPTARTWPA